MTKKKIGLVLTGGGARGAYQAGVLKGVAEITKKMGLVNPLSIYAGISVGAINAAFLASHTEDFSNATARLEKIWLGLRTKQIVHTGTASLGKIASRWILELATGKMIKRKKARSLLDNTPLQELISKKVDFNKIEKNIKDGYLDSLVITAVNYADGKNYIFIESREKVKPWIRERREVVNTKITKDHILASSALPLFFPPRKIGEHYYADGNIRNDAPLSPPIRLGAEKLLVIPLRLKESGKEDVGTFGPTLGRMLSVLFNALLLDAIDFDFERLARINETVSLLPKGAKTPLKKIDVCMMRPSENIVKMANENACHLPKSFRFLLGGLGSSEEAGMLTSTLLFEPPFTKKLIELGYEDALSQREEIIQFFS